MSTPNERPSWRILAEAVGVTLRVAVNDIRGVDSAPQQRRLEELAAEAESRRGTGR